VPILTPEEGGGRDWIVGKTDGEFLRPNLGKEVFFLPIKEKWGLCILSPINRTVKTISHLEGSIPQGR